MYEEVIAGLGNDKNVNNKHINRYPLVRGSTGDQVTETWNAILCPGVKHIVMFILETRMKWPHLNVLIIATFEHIAEITSGKAWVRVNRYEDAGEMKAWHDENNVFILPQV